MLFKFKTISDKECLFTTDGNTIRKKVAFCPSRLIDQRAIAAIDCLFDAETDTIEGDDLDLFWKNYDFLQCIWNSPAELKTKYPVTYKSIKNIF